jgi:transcriptional regulator
MYIPPAFQITDRGKLAKFMRANSFATVITQTSAGPFASHLPLLFEAKQDSPELLLGHMAKANAQWQHFANGQEVLAIFHGPHAYVSPRFYKSTVAVPTWNYATVHAYGTPQIFSDRRRVADLVRETIRFYEGDGPEAWLGELPSDYLEKMLNGIVGFQIAITRIEGKFKFGQNRSPEDITGVYQALSHSPEPQDRALANLMREEGWPVPEK